MSPRAAMALATTVPDTVARSAAHDTTSGIRSSEDGLGDVGGGGAEASVPAIAVPDADKPDAVVLAYVCGNEVAYSWHRSLIQLATLDGRLHQRLGADLERVHALRYGTGGLIEARNQAVFDFLEEYPEADWLFWLDTDMGFPAETLELLLAAADPIERPIVGALCFSQQEIESDGMGGPGVSMTTLTESLIAPTPSALGIRRSPG
jgi:hypothetical protein